MANTTTIGRKAQSASSSTNQAKETREETNSKRHTDPAMQAACTLDKLADPAGGLTDLIRSVHLVKERAEHVSQGDLSNLEEMLTAQATTLDVVFNTLTRRAVMNVGEYMDAAETYMKLALRAQAQCRSSIEALAEIKNPKPVFLSGQTNIANGHQQVNNSSCVTANKISPNKLVEDATNELPENRGTQALTCGEHQALETVGTIDRAKVSRG